MSEGYPQGQEQQFPTQDNEQSGDQPQREGEDVQVTEPNSVEENVGTDTRWDHDKAETMAAVLKMDGTFDKNMKNRSENDQFINSGDYLARDTQLERDNLEKAKKMVPNPDGFGGDYSKKSLEGAQEDYDNAAAETQAKGQRAIEKNRERVDESVDEVLSPYQELYDRNPSVFAEMPTAEFMGIAKEFSEISSRIEENERDAESLKNSIDKIRIALENKTTVNWDVIVNFSYEIAGGLHMSTDEWVEVREKFEAECDYFNKPGRQIMEDFIRVGEEYISQFEAKKLADEQRSKELLDKYGPETSTTDQN